MVIDYFCYPAKEYDLSSVNQATCMVKACVHRISNLNDKAVSHDYFKQFFAGINNGKLFRS